MLSGLIITSVFAVTMYPHEWPSLIVGLYIYCGYCTVWFAFDCFLQLAIDSKLFKNTNFFVLFLAWLVREWTTVYIIIRSVVNLTQVSWSGVEFTVDAGGQSHANQITESSSNHSNASSSSSSRSSINSESPLVITEQETTITTD